MKGIIEKLKKFVERYERHISSIALIGGFILDSLTFQRIDRFFDTIIIILYIVLAGVCIFIQNVYEGGYFKKRIFEKMHSFLPIAIQFLFGGLFSAFLVAYFRSASIAVSWPFVATLLILLVGNELFKKFYKRMVFTMSIYFFCLFTFSIFYVPILAKKISDPIFLLSGVVSLLIMALFITLLTWIIPQRMKEVSKLLAVCILSIYGIITVLYFLNIIPPIPLSLKAIAVGHSVSRNGNDYVVEQELPRTLEFLRLRKHIHIASGEPVYVYSAVFAPTALTTDVVHHWRYYDQQQGAWITKSKIPFSIRGGRDGGYRGYTSKTAMTPGLWDVRVETPRGQVIGSISFTVESVEAQPGVYKAHY